MRCKICLHNERNQGREKEQLVPKRFKHEVQLSLTIYCNVVGKHITSSCVKQQGGSVDTMVVEGNK